MFRNNALDVVHYLHRVTHGGYEMDLERNRKIIHIDMDAFYASVEQRDFPSYRGKPVIVGGSPQSRGVVATCSYEARAFGVHSAMPSSIAIRRCPSAIFVTPRMDVYRDVSLQLMTIFRSYTHLVEPLSLDEAYLDVTDNHRNNPSATLIARDIKREILRQTGLTASAGVSFNKFIAKIASDFNKPNGLTVVTPAEAQSFLDAVPIRKFFGIGKVTEQRLVERGIRTGIDLRNLSMNELMSLFGDRGKLFYQLVRGHDLRTVQPDRIRKSIGKEQTLQVDISDEKQMLEILHRLSKSVAASLVTRGVRGRVVVLKLKFSDFKQVTKRTVTQVPVDSEADIFSYAADLLKHIRIKANVRLLGVTVQDLVPATHAVQSTLF